MDLSVCIPCYNRSRLQTEFGVIELLPKCLAAISKCVQPIFNNYEVVIADYHSTDYPLREWVHDIIPDVTIIDIDDDKFSRGKALNIAASNAKHKNLCFMDTDMVMTGEFFQLASDSLSSGRAFFPVCYMYKDYLHTKGFFCTPGFGICCVNRNSYDLAGGFQDRKTWGLEDTIFFDRVCGICHVDRPHLRSLEHMWHPDSYEFKNAAYNKLQ